MNRGYVLEASSIWADAESMFAKVVRLIPTDLDLGLRAKEELAWCQIRRYELGNGLAGLQKVLNILGNLDARDSSQARCLWRIGKCYWEMGGNLLSDRWRLIH
jgi:superkiller protein 3